MNHQSPHLESNTLRLNQLQSFAGTLSLALLMSIKRQVQHNTTLLETLMAASSHTTAQSVTMWEPDFDLPVSTVEELSELEVKLQEPSSRKKLVYCLLSYYFPHNHIKNRIDKQFFSFQFPKNIQLCVPSIVFVNSDC